MKISEKTVFKFDPLVLFPFYIILAVILISGMFNLLHHDKFLTVYYNGSKKDDQNFMIKVKNKNSIIESFFNVSFMIFFRRSCVTDAGSCRRCSISLRLRPPKPMI